MNKKILNFIFFIITLILLFFVIVFFYSIKSQKELIIERNQMQFEKLSSEIITGRIREYLITENRLEAIRILNQFKASNFISSFSFEESPSNKRCNPIFFNDEDSSNIWGYLCLHYPLNNFSSSSLNLSSYEVKFLYFTLIILLIVILSYLYLTNSNKNLLKHIHAILNIDQFENNSSKLWSPILKTIATLNESNIKKQNRLTQIEINNKKNELALKLSHDIKSPLDTIQYISKNIENIDRNQIRNSLNNATDRILDIANDILNEEKKIYVENKKMIELYGLILNIVEEKRQILEESNIIIEIKPSSKMHVTPNFKIISRILSNILNNSIEAISEANKHGLISIILKKEESNIILEVTDNGPGFPPALLKEIGKNQVASNKRSGTGIGLYYAIKDLAEINSKLLISNNFESGATIQIIIPDENKNVCILLDDDKLVQTTWNIFAKKNDIVLTSYYTPDDLFNQIPFFKLDTPIYIDSNLKDGIKGEDIAIKLHKQGFTNISITSGHHPDKFAHLTFLKEIRGKSPPW